MTNEQRQAILDEYAAAFCRQAAELQQATTGRDAIVVLAQVLTTALVAEFRCREGAARYLAALADAVLNDRAGPELH